MAKTQTVNVGGLTVKQSVINSLERVGFNLKGLEELASRTDKVTARNRFSGEGVETTPLVYRLIDWVYSTSNDFDRGDYTVKIADFDRIRYFVLELDSKAYMTCLD